MSRPKRWVAYKIKQGIFEIRLSSWKYFSNYINDNLLDYNSLIWRGQKRYNWKLEPSLDRIFKNQLKSKSAKTREEHLNNFKYATRGRRGYSPPDLSEDEWWALGQHQGLATPLLDWTTSPYVAAYFAFAENETADNHRRAIWALSTPGVIYRSNLIKNAHVGKDRPPIIEIVKPFSNDNSRLVNQSGLFTRAPDNVDIETWVYDNLKDIQGLMYLIKITVPESEREIVLRSLNRMNINHLTLFPDLYGASTYCNLDLLIDKY